MKKQTLNSIGMLLKYINININELNNIYNEFADKYLTNKKKNKGKKMNTKLINLLTYIENNFKKCNNNFNVPDTLTKLNLYYKTLKFIYKNLNLVDKNKTIVKKSIVYLNCIIQSFKNINNCPNEPNLIEDNNTECYFTISENTSLSDSISILYDSIKDNENNDSNFSTNSNSNLDKCNNNLDNCNDKCNDNLDKCNDNLDKCNDNLDKCNDKCNDNLDKCNDNLDELTDSIYDDVKTNSEFSESSSYSNEVNINCDNNSKTKNDCNNNCITNSEWSIITTDNCINSSNSSSSSSDSCSKTKDCSGSTIPSYSDSCTSITCTNSDFSVQSSCYNVTCTDIPIEKKYICVNILKLTQDKCIITECKNKLITIFNMHKLLKSLTTIIEKQYIEQLNTINQYPPSQKILISDIDMNTKILDIFYSQFYNTIKKQCGVLFNDDKSPVEIKCCLNNGEEIVLCIIANIMILVDENKNNVILYINNDEFKIEYINTYETYEQISIVFKKNIENIEKLINALYNNLKVLLNSAKTIQGVLEYIILN